MTFSLLGKILLNLPYLSEGVTLGSSLRAGWEGVESLRLCWGAAGGSGTRLYLALASAELSPH